MTTESISISSTEKAPESSVYLIAGRMDAQSKLLAKKLHELGYIYALYGALDGLSISYSMFKYLFDLLNKTNASDAMHEWMVSPEGLAIAASTTISFIAFSMLANHFKDDDKNKFKSYVAIIWPYVRDVTKGLKNAYKGFRALIQVFELLGAGNDLRSLIVPVGVFLGVLSAANRVWMRYEVNRRKDMMKANAQLLADVKDKPSMSLEEIAQERAKIQSQSMALRRMMLLSSVYGGIVDGLYLYVGVLSLCSLAPPAFIAMTVFCAIYFIACVATRFYEEYDFQRRLVIAQVKIELALTGRELEENITLLNNLSLEISEEKQDGMTDARKNLQTSLVDKIGELNQNFKENRAYLHKLSTLSLPSAFFAGMKNGLAAYGALASIMFAVATVIVLASANFPPALLITCVALGMALLIGFIAHSLIYAHRHQVEQNEKAHTNPENKELQELLQKLKETNNYIDNLKPDHVKDVISKGMVVDSSPQFFYQEWFEIARSFFSGLGKGSKAVDFTMINFQERAADGHYHDTPIMFVITAFSAVIHAVALALRAHSRGFGKPPIDSVVSNAQPSETEGRPVTSSHGGSECEIILDSPCASNLTPPLKNVTKTNLIEYSIFPTDGMEIGPTSSIKNSAGVQELPKTSETLKSKPPATSLSQANLAAKFGHFGNGNNLGAQDGQPQVDQLPAINSATTTIYW